MPAGLFPRSSQIRVWAMIEDYLLTEPPTSHPLPLLEMMVRNNCAGYVCYVRNVNYANQYTYVLRLFSFGDDGGFMVNGEGGDVDDSHIPGRLLLVSPVDKSLVSLLFNKRARLTRVLVVSLSYVLLAMFWL